MHNSTSHRVWEDRFERNKAATISQLLPYTGIILTICCIVIFLARYYLIEPLVRRLYSTRYTALTEAQRRSFINHHVAAGSKLALIALAAYPFCVVYAGVKTIHSPFVHGSSFTIGDMLVIVTQVFTAMYIFELFYRQHISIISVLHHIGGIVIAQAATVLCLNPAHRSDSTIEFILCIMWGMFDAVAELWPHLAMIYYRILPTRHAFLAKVLLATTLVELIGTLAETVTVMAIFGSVWDQWTLEFKILTPILHLLFTAAQLWGAWIFWGMYLQQQRMLAQRDDLESGSCDDRDSQVDATDDLKIPIEKVKSLED